MRTKLQDLSGLRFGKLTVINRTEPRISKNTIHWDVVCECGNSKAMAAGAIKKAESCGCNNLTANSSDYTGSRFGFLTAIKRIPNGKGMTRYLCQCQCGRVKIILGTNLTGGSVKSCGCKTSEMKRLAVTHPAGFAAATQVIRAYTRRAKDKRLEFSLSRDVFLKIVQSQCTYCGATGGCFSKMKTGVFEYTGIDRNDSTLGYTESNSLPCCINCNRMKMAHPHEWFKQKIHDIYHHLVDPRNDNINWMVA